MYKENPARALEPSRPLRSGSLHVEYYVRVFELSGNVCEGLNETLGGVFFLLVSILTALVLCLVVYPTIPYHEPELRI